ncbi:MAG: hypothetical protein A2Z99_20790 [Treponema sp. GWB1_62_6]|nr:MAG: hypothetical protein A2Y36_02350 [Treponema sp. GWA1_62_8]OHE67378.1 MAG: hypothetical protein A2001_07145 [Treponema sp. GWC1_61_84]OHE71211.1 MAG: hypothetical protein A2Z99_20790 [Treponema sp. GWB1_62_6]OHE76007.1 MAG: hypothetical protein A2413_17615 [Treponema sp. RIFOXYC1_FULL_61_9]HCM27469.1 amino acid-binding protein [Treponema sp.]
MKAHALVTAIGSDRVGIVEDMAAEILEFGCNIEESRMALLGGDFAVLLLVSGESAPIDKLIEALDAVGSRLGLVATARRTRAPETSGDALPYLLESASLDTPGIVRSVAAVLRRSGVNIADLETDTAPAPWTGAPMFTMRARLLVPRGVSVSALRKELETVELEHNLDLTLKSAAMGVPEV